MFAKILLYISGIIGGSFLVSWFVGVAIESPNTRLFLIIGMAVLMFLFLPLQIYNSYQRKKKIKQIIESYKGQESKQMPLDTRKSEVKGWDMNTSPFRKRKSGLTWGGGNVHAANADRGTRRSFLKR